MLNTHVRGIPCSGCPASGLVVELMTSFLASAVHTLTNCSKEDV